MVTPSGAPRGVVLPGRNAFGFFAKESQYSVVAVQACPGRVASVTFAVGGEPAKAYFEELGAVVLDGLECRVAQPPPPPPQLSTVVVSWFPFEGPNEAITSALSAYGSIKSVRHQVWPDRPSVSTESRIVSMVVKKEIPRFISVRGASCKVWYRVQPLRCDLCHKVGHRSAQCPLKGKCFKCAKEGHLARNGPNLARAPPAAEPVVDPAAVPPCEISLAEEGSTDPVIADSEDDACSLPDSDASEDRFASCDAGNNDVIIPAAEGFASPADTDMAGDSGLRTTVSRKRPASPVTVSAPSKSAAVSPESDLLNGGPDVLCEVPELAACSADHRAILWEIAAARTAHGL
ncbi:hypothetical protein AWC38_SpisGene22684 [Stylophora pistillata]|uniref:CCHC-type domain-containing protein n=1 Tax=Stylophora pistillata TaxID=50429 RepID=A0A2B4R9S6_STYPI|nr:hypothetical protein AWC38_SpisGene22684 [Stylophora pistillata]